MQTTVDPTYAMLMIGLLAFFIFALFVVFTRWLFQTSAMLRELEAMRYSLERMETALPRTPGELGDSWQQRGYTRNPSAKSAALKTQKDAKLRRNTWIIVGVIFALLAAAAASIYMLGAF